MAEDNAKRAMADAARLAEELRHEQEHAGQIERLRRALESQVVSLLIIIIIIIIFETLGPMNLSAFNLLNDLGRKISSVSGDDREGHFLFQRLSVILQRYNAVLLHESFVQSDGLDL